MTLARAALVASLLLAVPRPTAAQYVGVAQCATKCHREAKKAWTSFHQTALPQLDDPKKAKAYAAPVGGNTRDARCLACHTASRVGAVGDAVGCESCHDPGGAYLKPHQKAVFAGLKPIYNDPSAIARLCVECHVLSPKDKDFADAGHPTGRDFAVGPKLQKMKHWPSEDVETRPRTYDAAFYAKVGAAGAPLVARAPAGSGGAVGAAPAAPAPFRPAPPARSAASAVSAADDEYKDLGADEFVTPPAPVPAPAATRRSSAVGAVAAAPAPPAPRPPKPPRELLKTPAPDDVPTYPAEVTPVPAPAATPTPAAEPARVDTIAALRGRAARALTRAAREGKTLPPAAPKPPTAFDGPDGELLELQDEALALALEALSGKQ
jgi:hypothetical protein